jgi:peptidoglycan hydrolase-like protein with peptidoglycan-binding domain
MGKYLTSLLILASSILLPDEIFADEQVRRVQEELRKRHLFYADANGEHDPALTAAIKRYQQRKGFAPTGVIDSEILASLGIIKLAPLATKTPVVVANRGDVHGANGERLPSYPPFFSSNHERLSEFDLAIIDQHIVLALAPDGRLAPRRNRAGSSGRPMDHQNATGAPFQITFELANERTVQATTKAVGNTLVLPSGEMPWELGAIDEELAPQAAVKSNRPSTRRSRRVRPRKETNPIILTYQTVDRAIRNLFGDAQPKRKRATAKRL